jgi:hypothetical protein
MIGLISGFGIGLTSGLRIGVIAALYFTLIMSLVYGLTGGQVESSTRPGQRLRQTTLNIFLTIMWALLVAGLFALFALVPEYGWRAGLCGGLFLGIMLGVIFGLRRGIVTLIQHYLLRFMLVRMNLMPWFLVPFLDHCVDLIFLRRVGGGYIFVHRLLMEHFAAMYQEEPK